MYDIFQTVWHDCGFTWEDMQEWLVQKHVPSMQIIHIEVTITITTTITIIVIPIMSYFSAGPCPQSHPAMASRTGDDDG